MISFVIMFHFCFVTLVCGFVPICILVPPVNYLSTFLQPALAPLFWHAHEHLFPIHISLSLIRLILFNLSLLTPSSVEDYCTLCHIWFSLCLIVIFLHMSLSICLMVYCHARIKFIFLIELFFVSLHS